jgi:hypothetical protein
MNKPKVSLIAADLQKVFDEIFVKSRWNWINKNYAHGCLFKVEQGE